MQGVTLSCGQVSRYSIVNGLTFKRMFIQCHYRMLVTINVRSPRKNAIVQKQIQIGFELCCTLFNPFQQVAPYIFCLIFQNVIYRNKSLESNRFGNEISVTVMTKIIFRLSCAWILQHYYSALCVSGCYKQLLSLGPVLGVGESNLHLIHSFLKSCFQMLMIYLFKN